MYRENRLQHSCNNALYSTEPCPSTNVNVKWMVYGHGIMWRHMYKCINMTSFDSFSKDWYIMTSQEPYLYICMKWRRSTSCVLTSHDAMSIHLMRYDVTKCPNIFEFVTFVTFIFEFVMPPWPRTTPWQLSRATSTHDWCIMTSQEPYLYICMLWRSSTSCLYACFDVTWCHVDTLNALWRCIAPVHWSVIASHVWHDVKCRHDT